MLPPLIDLEDDGDTTNLILDSSEPDEHEHASLNWDSSDDLASPMRRQRTQSLVDIYDAPHAFLATNSIIPMHAYLLQVLDPQTYAEAIGNPHWEAAMDEEYNSLIANQTWELIFRFHLIKIL